MLTNGNLSAPISILLFLGTGMLILVIGLGLVYSILKKRAAVRKIAPLLVIPTRRSYSHVLNVDRHIAQLLSTAHNRLSTDPGFNKDD